MHTYSTKHPKVSVLVPVYNVEKYLVECMNSIVGQTLQDIEIICINDGSTDSSLEILQRYAQSDTRIVIIDKRNSGYGDSMNKGLEKATGTYIGIVESDDLAEPDMFESLYQLAEKHQLDVVKSNFYEYLSAQKSNQKVNLFLPEEINTVLDPINSSRDIFLQQPCIWAGLYRRNFLIENDITFLPTAGASYQDTGFNFKVWATAAKVYFTDAAYLHYRIDNEGSSVKSLDKLYYVNAEYRAIEEYLDSRELLSELGGIMAYAKFGAYYWNLTRLPKDLAREYLHVVREEFLTAQSRGLLDLTQFDPYKRRILTIIMYRPWLYFFAQRAYGGALLINRYRRSILQSFSPRYQRKQRISLQNSIIRAQNEQIARKAHLLEQQIDTLSSPKCQTIGPEVSVIVPIYNTASYLSKCLDSLIGQTLENIEILCINDGSTDSSEQILDEYARNDNRIKVFSQQNAGQSAARNKGIEAAQAQYIMFCDSDDYYDVTMCEKMLNVIKNNDVDLAMCGTNITYLAHRNMRYSDDAYYGLKQVGKWSVDDALLLSVDYAPTNKIFKKSMLDEHAIRYPDNLLYEDAFFCPAYLALSHKIHFVFERLYHYVRRPNSTMSGTWGSGKTDRSVDHLRIAIKLHGFFEEHGIIPHRQELFWQIFVAYYNFAYRWAKSGTSKSEIRSLAETFISGHRLGLNGVSSKLRTLVQELVTPRHAVKLRIEKLGERVFRSFSFGYRRQKSMIDEGGDEIGRNQQLLAQLDAISDPPNNLSQE